MIKFLLGGIFHLIFRALGFIASLAHSGLAFVWRAHVVLFRNLVTPRDVMTGTLVKKQVRRE